MTFGSELTGREIAIVDANSAALGVEQKQLMESAGNAAAGVIRETADADTYYEEQQRATRQEEQLEEMSLDDVQQALNEGHTFDALSPRDVKEEVLKKRLTRRVSGAPSDREPDTQLRDSLVQEAAAEEGPRAALNALKDVKRAENGLCAYCGTNARTRCSSCGELVCREHMDSQGGIGHPCHPD